ncbi:NAD(P)-binding protein [Zoogloea sp.]|uniref:NAD(P)-binding protein n=1 Tax=Zoogloea sp. TaxID=49181 RepID=UPI0026346B3F|nr:NAD(P)-binding protein [uncultured Zoogloea sp.]
MIGRRRFLATAAAAGLAALPGCRRLEHLGIPITVLRPGMEAGHGLRAGAPRPTPQREIHTGVAILGSGIAGLSAAWRLAREGHDDFLLVEGPEPFGNAAGGQFDSPSGPLAFPRGAHYLPLPSLESKPVRELLHELGVIEADPFGPRPRFSEAALVHAPDERLYFAGAWRDGLLPTAHVGTDEAAQHARFLAETARLTQATGADDRRAFCVPLALSSTDPVFRRLDGITFRAWLAAEGYTSPSLHTYLDYVCRDEYGATPDKVSAWAGLHYFASRGGQATNAPDGSLLTWPDGLAFLARGLAARVPAARQLAGHALAVEADRQGVSILCTTADGPVRIHARRAICAMPLHVAARVVGNIRDYGFDPAAHLPPQAPWLVASFLLEGFPPEPADAPLAWDNVIAGSRGLGWVVSTHQLIRAARPAHTVFTAYRALADQTPQDARAWLATAPVEALFELAAEELRSHYGPLEMWRRTRAVEICLRGHGMSVPACGSLGNPGLAALREADGQLLFAHSDLSGYSVFEEAAWWGDRAARKVLG